MIFDLLIKNISELVTMEGYNLGIVENASVVIHDGKISKVCRTGDEQGCHAEMIIDASGKVVMPGFVDCHTHLVFGGSRADEFEKRMKGATYAEIAREGGGILSTVKATRRASFEELYEKALDWLNEMLCWGTTTVEIKSGYGLNLADELKQLSVIRSLAEDAPQTLIPTFLGAHAVPPEIKKDEYISLLADIMLPEVAEKGLAQFFDVFCDSIAFSNNETKKLVEKAKEYGLKIKLHVDEIEDVGGAKLAADLGAVSAEHLVKSNEEGLRRMAERGVVPVLLPATTFFLKEQARPNVKLMRELKMPIAVASDFNPGSSTVYALPFASACGVLLDDLTLEEALKGITTNAAKALGIDDAVGSIREGKDADLVILDSDSWKNVVYYFNRNFVVTVVKKGQVIYDLR